MERTSKKAASETQRLKACSRTTFPVSLFRSKKSGQVLYLEAGKDFVDTLLSFLLLPLGTIIHMLAAGIQVKSALGGVSNIFESVQNLSATDLQVAKEHLTRPRPAAIGCSCRSSGLAMQRALEDASILPRPPYKPGLHGDFYRCGLCARLDQSVEGGYCGACRQNPSTLGYTYFDSPDMTAYSVFEKEAGSTVGFVNASITFLVTDNLEIMPLTTNRSMLVLSKLKVDSLADLEGNDITVSFTQQVDDLSMLLSNPSVTPFSSDFKHLPQ